MGKSLIVVMTEELLLTLPWEWDRYVNVVPCACVSNDVT